MAREIDLTKTLSEDDLRYLTDRNRWADIRRNAENLGLDVPNLPTSRDLRAQVPRNRLRDKDAFEDIAQKLGVTTEAASEDADEAASDEQKPVDYSKLTVPQLKEALDKRRADYEAVGDSEAVADVSYTAEDKKGDLVAKLQLDDEASSEGDDGDE